MLKGAISIDFYRRGRDRLTQRGAWLSCLRFRARVSWIITAHLHVLRRGGVERLLWRDGEESRGESVIPLGEVEIQVGESPQVEFAVP